MGKAIRNFLSEGAISIKGRTKLLYQLGPAATSPILSFYLDQILGGLPQFGNTIYRTDLLVFQLLGSFSNTDWNRLDRTGTIHLSASSVNQKLLAKIVRFDGLPIKPTKRIPDLYQHELELFPNGLAGKLDGTFKVSPELVVAMERDGGDLHPTKISDEAGFFPTALRVIRSNGRPTGRIVVDRKLFEQTLAGDQRFWHTAKGHSYSLNIALPMALKLEWHASDVSTIEKRAVKTVDLPEPYLRQMYDDVKRVTSRCKISPIPTRSLGSQRTLR